MARELLKARADVLDLMASPSNKVDVAQWVDELAVPYTNTRLRHQRNKVPFTSAIKLQRRNTW